MITYRAIVTYGYDRDDWQSWTFDAPNIDAAVKTARYSNPYEGMGYWRIHRVRPADELKHQQKIFDMRSEAAEKYKKALQKISA